MSGRGRARLHTSGVEFLAQSTKVSERFPECATFLIADRRLPLPSDGGSPASRTSLPLPPVARFAQVGPTGRLWTGRPVGFRDRFCWRLGRCRGLRRVVGSHSYGPVGKSATVARPPQARRKVGAQRAKSPTVARPPQARRKVVARTTNKPRSCDDPVTRRRLAAARHQSAARLLTPSPAPSQTRHSPRAKPVPILTRPEPSPSLALGKPQRRRQVLGQRR
jgi:hypothetical protein